MSLASRAVALIVGLTSPLTYIAPSGSSATSSPTLPTFLLASSSSASSASSAPSYLAPSEFARKLNDVVLILKRANIFVKVSARHTSAREPSNCMNFAQGKPNVLYHCFVYLSVVGGRYFRAHPLARARVDISICNPSILSFTLFAPCASVRRCAPHARSSVAVFVALLPTRLRASYRTRRRHVAPHFSGKRGR